jgi:signal transduction histidine kinase
VILAALFGLAIYIFETAELRRAHDILRPAILQTSTAADKHGLLPDLSEVVQSNPQLSFGAFDLHGKLIASEGAISIGPSFKWAYSMIGKPTNQSHIEWGIIEIGKSRVIAGSISNKEGLLVGVLPWNERERTMDLATIAVIALWFPLVGLVGAVTWMASARTFLPLESLTRQAELFSESDLSRRLQIDTQDEFGLFAKRLNHFLDRIEDSVDRQQRFVEDAAHELRTPLTILRGRILQLSIGKYGGLTNTQRLVDRIYRVGVERRLELGE